MSPCADAPGRPVTCTRAHVDAHERIPLTDGWSAAATAPGSLGARASVDGLRWIAARVPGTAAGALRDAGLSSAGRDLDAEDWLFRTSFGADAAAAGEEVVLCLDGIATVAEVHLNGELVCEVRLDVRAPRDRRRRASARRERPADRVPGARARCWKCSADPRARWRTRLAACGLRFFRTMLLGRAPGFAPGPAAVGPWRRRATGAAQDPRRRRAEGPRRVSTAATGC